MNDRVAPVCMLLLALGGCASGPEAVPEALPPGEARLHVTRGSDVLLYAAVKATVEVNGARVAEIKRDDGYSATFKAGMTTVSAYAASPPGRYTIRFNSEPGKIYRLEVSPRREGYVPPTTLGKIGNADFMVTENDGAFKLEPDR